MRASQESKELADRLGKVSEHLAAAIAQAIENPLLLAESPSLAGIEALCAGMAGAAPQDDLRRDTAIEKLVWEVRARAGRLQHLLDSAARFYAARFATPQALATADASTGSLAYRVHGDWSETPDSGYLIFDC